MRPSLLAVLALLSAAPSRADWTGPRFDYDPVARVWTRAGGEPADHNLFDPDNNFTARFQKGKLKVLFDNFPDAGPAQKADDIYAFGDDGVADRLGKFLGRTPGPVDLLFSAATSRAAKGAETLVRQTFADGIWTNARREDGCDVTETQFLTADSAAPRALVQRFAVKNVSSRALKLTARAVLWTVMEKAVFDYWRDMRPAWTSEESFDPGLRAAVARSADGRLWLAAGAIDDKRELTWAPQSAPDVGAAVVLWGTEAALAPGETRAFTLTVAVGATRDEAAAAYARLAAAGPDAAEAGTRAAWRQRLWERGAFATGDPSLDSLNYLKYVLDGNYAAENGGFTAAKYGHPEIWARDSGYTALSGAYFEPARTRESLETAIHSGYVAGEDGTSMLVIASEHYARWTGDRAFAQENAGALQKSMQGLWDLRGKSGFLVDRGGGLDTWRDMPAQQEKLKGQANMYQQVLFSAALDRLSRLLDELGRSDEARVWLRRSRDVAKALNRAVDRGGFWRPGAGFYADYVDPRDPAGLSHFDEVGHSLGVLWGIFPPDRRASVMERASRRLANPDGLGHADVEPYGKTRAFNDGEVWPFANFLEAGAQLASGRDADFMSLMKDMSKTMSIVPGGLTESLGFGQSQGGVNPVSTSWNSAGLYVMTRELFGVDGDGFRRRLTLSPRIPDQLRGAVLSLTRLPFSDWLVSITYRLLEGGEVAVAVNAERPGRPDERVQESFSVENGASRTVPLP
jgi:hypothetical protein